MRKQLAEYCDQYDDCNVPHRWPDNRAPGKLVSWQRNQRMKFDQDLNATMTKERVTALESMGFVWKIRS
jgi:hypothetical protein